MLTPSQLASYIGAVLDATEALAFLPPECALKIQSFLSHFRPLSMVTAHRSQKLLGLMASTTSVLPLARLKMRSLQVWFLSLFYPLEDPPNSWLLVSPELTQQLLWWVDPSNPIMGRPFAPL